MSILSPEYDGNIGFSTFWDVSVAWLKYPDENVIKNALDSIFNEDPKRWVDVLNAIVDNSDPARRFTTDWRKLMYFGKGQELLSTLNGVMNMLLPDHVKGLSAISCSIDAATEKSITVNCTSHATGLLVRIYFTKKL